ncbi:MAG: hypothetical protein Kow0069_14030 [Promethearchaeota archaeon]
MPKRTVAFVSYESSYAPAGGLAAVMSRLPLAVERRLGCRALLLAPFFPRHPRTREAVEKGELSPVGDPFEVWFAGGVHEVTAYGKEVESSSGGRIVHLLGADGFFDAEANPYVFPGDQGDRLLRRNAYFFCAAAGAFLKLATPKGCLVHPQDWHGALVVDALPDAGFKCVLTLHNPYDQPLHPEEFAWLFETAPPPVPQNSTVLKHALRRVAAVSAVSENFALELTRESPFVDVLVPHLQGELRAKPPVGINNGKFVDLREGLDSLLLGDGSPPEDRELARSFADFKRGARDRLNDVFETSSGRLLREEAWGACEFGEFFDPLFVMFGRDDPRQKGFDVFAQVARELLEGGPDGGAGSRFAFTPLPGPHGKASLAYLEQLASDFPDKVTVFPSRMSVGYVELMEAATYLVMCSLYEPFGGATEGYARGVPVVARATGGLVQQVDPLNFDALPQQVKTLVVKYHGVGRRPTGFLFKEPGPTNPREAELRSEEWRRVFAAPFLNQSPVGNSLESRSSMKLFGQLVASAKQATLHAAKVYQDRFEEYYRMARNGAALLDRFTWEKSAEAYGRLLYSRASN